jgi:hypothetical protein
VNYANCAIKMEKVKQLPRHVRYLWRWAQGRRKPASHKWESMRSIWEEVAVSNGGEQAGNLMKIVWPMTMDSGRDQQQEPKSALKWVARLPLYLRCVLYQIFITLTFLVLYFGVSADTKISLKSAIVCYVVQTLIAWFWYADFLFVTPRGGGDKVKKDSHSH